jgi:hypothetical protein
MTQVVEYEVLSSNPSTGIKKRDFYYTHIKEEFVWFFW